MTHPLPATIEATSNGWACARCKATHLQERARGLCTTCHRIATANGTLNNYPSRRGEVNRSPAKRTASGTRHGPVRIEQTLALTGWSVLATMTATGATYRQVQGTKARIEAA